MKSVTPPTLRESEWGNALHVHTCSFLFAHTQNLEALLILQPVGQERVQLGSEVEGSRGAHQHKGAGLGRSWDQTERHDLHLVALRVRLASQTLNQLDAGAPLPNVLGFKI